MLSLLALCLFSDHQQVPVLSSLDVATVTPARTTGDPAYLGLFARLTSDGARAYSPAIAAGTMTDVETWRPAVDLQTARSQFSRKLNEVGKSAKDYSIVLFDPKAGQYVQPSVIAALDDDRIIVLGQTYPVAYEGPKRSGVVVVKMTPESPQSNQTLFASDTLTVTAAALDRNSLALLADLWGLNASEPRLAVIRDGRVTKVLNGMHRKGEDYFMSSYGPLLFDDKRGIAVTANPKSHGLKPPIFFSSKTNQRISHFGPPAGVRNDMFICGISWLPDGAALIGYASQGSAGRSGSPGDGLLFRVEFLRDKLKWHAVGHYQFRGASRSGSSLLISDPTGKGWLVRLRQGGPR